MATSQPSRSNTNDFEILKEITCVMCQRLYTDPVILPCLHYYCRGCLQEKARESMVTVCPKCHQEHELSEEGVHKLPRGVLAGNSAVSLHAIMAQRILQDCEVPCELCTHPSRAQAYCQQCTKYLCSFCEEAHNRIKTYASHVVFNERETPSTAETVIPRSPVEAQIKMICPDHDEELRAYCFECDELICRDCMLTQHKNHTNEFLKKAYDKIHTQMRSRKGALERRCKRLAEQQSRIADKIVGVQNEGKETSEFINKSFDIVLQQFEKYRSNLLQSIRNKTEQDAAELERLSRSMDMARTAVQPLLTLIQHNLERASREEMLTIHKKLLEQVSAREQHCQECLDSPTPPSEPFNTYRTSCARIIGAIGDSLRCADPIMCSLEGGGAQRSQVDKETSFLLRVNQSNEAPCTAIQNVQVEITAMDSCQQCDTRITIVKGNTYEVSYTPKLQGQHILKVRVNERPILGNPFHVLVKRPLLDVKEPVLIIRGVRKLHDIALHRNGDLLATQYESGLVLSIDKRGHTMKALMSGLGRPFGIATNQQGWIFLTKNRKCCLQKYSRVNELMGTTGCREGSLGNFNKPGRMALNKKGEIFVCDFKNSRVQVFDDDLEYLRWYSITKPTGVAVDEEGDIYVTENGKNSLCKVFVASRLGTATLREGLANPQGVYVDKEYIYITEKDSGQVTVLDHEGDFVTALGQGVLKSPGGIVGDQDGYLYVCDEELEAICVF